MVADRKDVTNGKLSQDMSDANDNFATIWEYLADIDSAKGDLDTLQAAMSALMEYAEFVENGLLSVANYKGPWVNLTGPLEAWKALYHSGTVWMSVEDIPDVTLSEPAVGNTDYINVSALLANEVAPKLGGPLDSNEHQIQASRGTDIASAATISVPPDGNYFAVTGTTGISGINTTGRVGTEFTLSFSGIVTLTHSSSLILPGDTDYITKAGSVLKFAEESAGIFRCTGLLNAGGGFEYGTPSEIVLSGQSYIEIEVDHTKKTLVQLKQVKFSSSTALTLNVKDDTSAVAFAGAENRSTSSENFPDYFISQTTAQLSGTLYTSYYLNGTIKLSGGAEFKSICAGQNAGKEFKIVDIFLDSAWDRIRLYPLSGTFSSGTIVVKEAG